MGLGKTLIGSLVAKAFNSIFPNCRALVVSPKTMKGDWEKSFEDHVGGVGDYELYNWGASLPTAPLPDYTESSRTTVVKGKRKKQSKIVAKKKRRRKKKVRRERGTNAKERGGANTDTLHRRAARAAPSPSPTLTPTPTPTPTRTRTRGRQPYRPSQRKSCPSPPGPRATSSSSSATRHTTSSP